jgi:hypothetical protein
MSRSVAVTHNSVCWYPLEQTCGKRRYGYKKRDHSYYE